MLPTDTATRRVRGFYDRFAPEYDGWMRPFDRLMLGDARRTLCARATGDTLEVAVGTGLNLGHYRPGVRLTAIDLTPSMLTIARERARRLGQHVRFHVADAQELPFPDASFDTAVFTLCLCTIPDERRALAEAHRVLRPGGQLFTLEHVRSDVPPVRWLQQLLEPPMVALTADHVLRDPADHLSSLGIRVKDSTRTRWGVIQQLVAERL